VILTAQQIEEAVHTGDLLIEPFDSKQVQAATYDLRVGPQGATTSSKRIVDIGQQGYLAIEPGDFAVVSVLEELRLGPQYAGRIGLRSKWARKGLVATTGPQIDPGYHGRLMVGLTNLTPNAITLSAKDDLLSVEFHKLEHPTDRPYSGPYQDRLEFGPEEMEAVTQGSGMALSEVLTTLRSVSSNVSSLAGSVQTLTGEMNMLRWLIPLIVFVGIGAITIIVALKP
jgi:dCTP deaminase